MFILVVEEFAKVQVCDATNASYLFFAWLKKIIFKNQKIKKYTHTFAAPKVLLFKNISFRNKRDKLGSLAVGETLEPIKRK